MSAVGATLGSVPRESGRPLYVGSVKTNIGHLEGCAGLAGLMKTVLCLENAVIVPSINFERPNPRLRMEEWNLKVADKLIPWPSDGLRRASINSFGYVRLTCFSLSWGDMLMLSREAAMLIVFLTMPIITLNCEVYKVTQPVSKFLPSALLSQMKRLTRALAPKRRVRSKEISNHTCQLLVNIQNYLFFLRMNKACCKIWPSLMQTTLEANPGKILLWKKSSSQT